jgi:hypothetical protein
MAERSLGEKLQSLPKIWLYIILFLVTSIPLWFTIPVPNTPSPASIDFYNFVKNNVKQGDTVIVASDWTNSTRGESGGEFKALVRVLMRMGAKLAIYSTADPQAPQVARNTIDLLNMERKAHGQPEYKKWVDYVSVGYIPNAEAAANSMQNNLRNAWKDKKDFDETGQLRSVVESPVLAKVSKISDVPCLILLTASQTSTITIERVTSVPILMMVTGVMGPETQVYYASKQIKGLVVGLKGVYDMETQMQKDWPDTAQFVNLDNGAKYYPTLHLALLLLILAVVIGNIGQAMTKRRSA